MREEGIVWHCKTRVAKFDEDISNYNGQDYRGREDEFYRLVSEPAEVVEKEGNLLLNAGADEIWDLICGTGTPTKYDASNAWLGVGDSATAAAAAQSNLQGSNKKWNAMEATYPQTSSQQAVFRASFAGGDANYQWNEWGIMNASGSGVMLNRKVENLGTKVSGTWQLSCTITLS